MRTVPSTLTLSTHCQSCSVSLSIAPNCWTPTFEQRTSQPPSVDADVLGRGRPPTRRRRRRTRADVVGHADLVGDRRPRSLPRRRRRCRAARRSCPRLRAPAPARHRDRNRRRSPPRCGPADLPCLPSKFHGIQENLSRYCPAIQSSLIRAGPDHPHHEVDDAVDRWTASGHGRDERAGEHRAEEHVEHVVAVDSRIHVFGSGGVEDRVELRAQGDATATPPAASPCWPGRRRSRTGWRHAPPEWRTAWPMR